MSKWSIFNLFGKSQLGYTESEIFYIVIIFLAIFIPIYFMVIDKSSSLFVFSSQSFKQLISNTQESIASTQKSINNIKEHLAIPRLSSNQIEFLNAQLVILQNNLVIQNDNLNILAKLTAK